MNADIAIVRQRATELDRAMLFTSIMINKIRQRWKDTFATDVIFSLISSTNTIVFHMKMFVFTEIKDR